MPIDYSKWDALAADLSDSGSDEGAEDVGGFGGGLGRLSDLPVEQCDVVPGGAESDWVKCHPLDTGVPAVFLSNPEKFEPTVDATCSTRGESLWTLFFSCSAR